MRGGFIYPFNLWPKSAFEEFPLFTFYQISLGVFILELNGSWEATRQNVFNPVSETGIGG